MAFFKKFLAVFFYLFIGSLFAFAQVSIEPEDDFYFDACAWEARGFVGRLPQLRPYPANVIYDILKTVEQISDINEARKAKYYLQKYFQKPWTLGFDFDYKGVFTYIEKTDSEDIERKDMKNLFGGSGYIGADVFANDFFSFGCNTGAIIYSDKNLPVEFEGHYLYKNRETLIDGYFFDFENADIVFDANAAFSFGNKNMYGSVGVNRVGFGNFPESNLILNPAAPQALNANFNYQGKFFDYSQYFGVLGAWNKFDEKSFDLQKFLMFHSFRIPFAKEKFFFSYFESVILGKTFQPAYFMPLPYAIISNVSGYADNVFAGIQLDWKPHNFLKLSSAVMFDDMKLKNAIKLKLNDVAIRTAFTFGIIYTPVDSICNFISFNYDLVTPYCYSYYDTSDNKYNLMDYSNFGVPMGLSLPPNSDRVSFKMNFKPTPKVRFSTVTTFIRHANPYQSLEDEEVFECCKNGVDGIFSDVTFKQNVQCLDTAEDFTDFLKQDTIMYVMQAAFNLDLDLFREKTKAVVLQLGYTFEYVRNDGVDKPIFDRTYSSVEEIHDARRKWRKNVSDLYNHYFAVSAKVFF